MLYSVTIFFIGVLLVTYFSEKLVEATVGTSMGFGVSTFLISVIFIGFDPENLALGAIASYDGVTGIAIGTIIGSAMVAIALALGITALIAPMSFKKVPVQVLLIPVLAVVLFGALSFDGLLSRFDGIILLAGYIISIGYLIFLGRRGLEIRPAGETAEALQEGREFGRWKAFGLLIISLIAIVFGSELIVTGSETIIAGLDLSDTLFGITILALIISIEELARELPAAMQGHPEITFGNVIGSALAFFLFNAGIIALVRPVPINTDVFNFYLPVSLAIVLFVTYMMMRKSIPRWAGGILVLGYLLFFVWGYFG